MVNANICSDPFILFLPTSRYFCFSMKLISILFCLLTLIFSYVTGQSLKADSLLKELAIYNEADTIRANLMADLAFELSKTDPAKGLLYADSVLQFALATGVEHRIVSALSIKAVNQAALGNDSIAFALNNQALERAIKSKDLSNQANIYQRISILYFNQADYLTALEFLEKGRSLVLQIHDTLRLAAVYNSMGVNHMRLGNYTEATGYYLKALAIYEASGKNEQVAMILSNIGIVYSRMDEPEKDVEYQNRALSIYESIGHKQGMVNCLGNLGNAYDNLDSLERALEYYQKAITLAKESGFTRSIANNLTNSSGIYRQQQRYKEALDALKKAISFYESAGDLTGAAVGYNIMGEIFSEAPPGILQKEGFNPSEKFRDAARYHEKALSSAHKANDRQNIFYSLRNLSLVYEKMNDYRQALDFYRKSVAVRDSMVNDKKKKEIERLQMQMEFDRKEAHLVAEHEKEILLADAEIEKQVVIRKFLTAGAVLLLLFSIAAFVMYKRRRDAIEQKHEAELKTEISETEMKALRAQMNPHFIFNTLNSILDTIQKMNGEKAAFLTSRFAKLMRLVLTNSEKREVPLSDDLAALSLYMEVESLRMNEKFSYSLWVDESIDQENTYIPPLILQPFVENSIWHGISKKEGKGKITVTIRKDENQLKCTVEDDGVGRKASGEKKTGQEGDSLGMKITADRLSVINKTKNARTAVILTDLNPGLRVDVLLPLEVEN